MTSAQVSRSCPVCAGKEAHLYLLKGDLRLVRCSGCGMLYVNPVHGDFASGDFYDQSGAGYYLSPAKLQADYAAVRFERELRIFRNHCSGGAVLDVGCSSGAFLYQLGQRFPGAYELLGTDASGPALDYAESQGLKVIRGDFLKQEFGGRQFDVVTFWAVLEHLVNPRAFLKKACSILKPNGLCFVLVPNMRSLAARILGARYRYIYPQHLNYFTRATLTKLVAGDFAIIERRSTHFNPIILWQDWRSRGREVSNKERAELLERTTAYKQSPLLRPLKGAYRVAESILSTLNLADNLVFVLRKKG